MCVVTRKTYVHPDNRREVVESYRLCHNAIGDRTCAYVETRHEEAVRVKERRPSSASSRRLSSTDLFTTSVGGREHHWKRFPRPSSKRHSFGRDSKASTASPVDSAASSVSPPALKPLYQEFRPSSASQQVPLMSGALPSARHSGSSSPTAPTHPPNPFRTVAPGGTAVYDRPPSLEMPRALDNERPSLSRRPSVSSTTAEVNDADELPPRPSIRRRVTIDPASSSSRHRASGGKGKSHARTDSLRDDVEREREKLLDEENERQARLERDRLAASNQRQYDRRSREQQRLDEAQAQIERDRLEAAETRRRSNLSREAEEAARRRAEDLRRDREDSSRERHRREAAAALEGHQQEADAEYARMLNAEYAAMDRERAAADARKRESAERYQELRGSPSSSRSNYTYAPSTPTSARQYTVTTRPPNAIHQYPSARRNSAILERGERVIAREQARTMGATQRLTEAMGGLGVEDEEAEMDTTIENEMQRAAARRARRELREREREWRRRQQGYY